MVGWGSTVRPTTGHHHYYAQDAGQESWGCYDRQGLAMNGLKGCHGEEEAYYLWCNCIRVSIATYPAAG
jgi:hypothetical protein